MKKLYKFSTLLIPATILIILFFSHSSEVYALSSATGSCNSGAPVVTVEWDSVPGTNSYYIRRDGVHLGTSPDPNTVFTDNGALANTYFRYFIGDVDGVWNEFFGGDLVTPICAYVASVSGPASLTAGSGGSYTGTFVHNPGSTSGTWSMSVRDPSSVTVWSTSGALGSTSSESHTVSASGFNSSGTYQVCGTITLSPSSTPPNSTTSHTACQSVTVSAPPVSVNLDVKNSIAGDLTYASSVTINTGESSTFRWVTSNANSCTGTSGITNSVIGSWNGTKPFTGGTQTVSFPSPGTYDAQIDCTGVAVTPSIIKVAHAQSTDSDSVIVYVVSGGGGTPPTTFTANPGACDTDTINLSWNGTGNFTLRRGATVIYTGTGNSFADTGLTQGQSYAYSLTDGTVTLNDSTIAPVACAGAVSVNLIASPASVSSGGWSLLTWTSSGATSCSASANPANPSWSGARGLNNLSGESTGALVNTTTFSLSCTGPGGTDSDGATVTVNSAFSTTPPTVSAQCDAEVDVSWVPYTGPGVSYYRVGRQATGVLPTIIPVGTTNYTDTGLTPGANHRYYVIAYDGGNNQLAITPDSSTVTVDGTACVSFAYNMSNDGPATITKGGASDTVTVTKTLTSGTTQPVNLSISGVPSGVTVTPVNTACSPTCNSTYTFSADNTVVANTYTITITGSTAGLPNQTTQFSLVVQNPPSLSVTCSPNVPSAFIGDTITWTANVSGGTAPYTYSWSGTDIPTAPAPDTNPYSIAYQTIGAKTAMVTIDDNASQQASCPGVAVQISVDPNFKEF